MKLTRAERKARETYKKDLIKQGVEKELAEVLTIVFMEFGIVNPVVGNIR